MKCPTCQGLTLVRPITGHESPFDKATGVTTRTRVCKDKACSTVFKTFERLDIDDANLRRQAFVADARERECRRLQAEIRDLKTFLDAWQSRVAA